MKKAILVLAASLVLNACNVVEQVTGAYNFSQCEYTYNSISNIQLSGMNLGSASSISLSNLASIATVLAGRSTQTIPFNMTLNLDVKNPNQTASASLNSMDYAININEMEFATGKMDIPLQINPGQTETLPISVSVDLRNLMNRYTQERVAKDLSSFLGISQGETKVTVKLWPSIMVGKTQIKSPAAIPVEFNFGGK